MTEATKQALTRHTIDFYSLAPTDRKAAEFYFKEHIWPILATAIAARDSEVLRLMGDLVGEQLESQ
jgi:hypothetical protein